MDIKKHFAIILIVAILLSSNVSFIMSLFMTQVNIRSWGSIGRIQPLHVEGRYIKNLRNETLVLRGVNWGEFASSCAGRWITPGKMDPAGFNVWNETAVRAHLQALKDWGCNVVRCQGQLSWWINNSSTTLTGQPTNQPFRYCIKRTIELCQEYGLYFILTWYSISPGSGQDGLPYPPYSHTDSGTVITSKQDFIDAWADIAKELKVYSNVLFELWNEPVWGNNEGMLDWFDTCQLCIDRIRSITDHIIIIHWGYCADVDWVQNRDYSWVHLDLFLDGTNLLFSGHMYRHHSSFDNDPNCPVDYEYIKSKIESPELWPAGLCYKKILEERNAPMFVGEIGGWYNPNIGISDDPDELTFFANALRVLNELGISYTAWVVQQATWSGFSLQRNEPAVQSPNENGQVLIDALAQAPFLG